MFDFLKRYYNHKKELNRIKRWQSDSSIHPFTCGNDSTHELLKGIVWQGDVILKCPDCGYTQKLPWYYYEIAHRLNP